MAFKSPLRGIQGFRKRAMALYGGGPYYQKVLHSSPIAYWPLWESSGTSAECLINSAQNGTYSSDVSGWPPQTGIGDGNTAPFFDGTNDWVNVDTATFHAALDGDTGTALLWRKVVNSGAWTDGSTRICCYLRDGGYTNLITLRKLNTNNDFNWRYDAGGTAESTTLTRSDTTWVPIAITWNKPGDEVVFYENGSSVGSSDTLGNWGGPTTVASIGADNGATKWHGWLAHVALWDRVLTQNEIEFLSGV